MNSMLVVSTPFRTCVVFDCLIDTELVDEMADLYLYLFINIEETEMHQLADLQFTSNMQEMIKSTNLSIG